MFLTKLPNPIYQNEVDYFGTTVQCPDDGYLFIAKDTFNQYYAIVHSKVYPTSNQYFSNTIHQTLISYVSVEGRYNFQESIMPVKVPTVISISTPIEDEFVKYLPLNINVEIPKANKNKRYLYLVEDTNKLEPTYLLMFSTIQPKQVNTVDDLFGNWVSASQRVVCTITTDNRWNSNFIRKSLVEV